MRFAQITFLATLLTAASVAAWAQPDLSGKWRATFETEGSESREAEVVIDGQAGTWMTYSRGTPKDRRDSCIARPFPIILSSVDSSVMSLSIEASKTVEGCSNRKARITIVDTNTLEGTFGNGRALKLTRK